MGSVAIGGPGEGIIARQRFIDSEAYRAARRGELIVNKFATRRRFAGWGEWAQERIRVRPDCMLLFFLLLTPGRVC